MSISSKSAYQLLVAAGFSPSQAVTMTAIGQAESGLNPSAVGDVSLENATWGPSVGIWQIRTLKSATGTGGFRDINALRGNPSFQARAARSIYSSQGLSAWSTYTSGAYKSHLGTAQKGSRAPIFDPGPAGAASASNAAYATPTGLPLPSVLNPLNWGGALANGFGNVAGGVAGGVFNAGWSVVQPFLLTGMFAVGGIALVLVGASALTKPVRDSVEETSQSAASAAAPLAMAV